MTHRATYLTLCFIASFGTAAAVAHPDHEHASTPAAGEPLLLVQIAPRSPEAPTPAATHHQASVSIEGDRRVITSNGWPDHEPGQFPRRGNPNRLSEQRHRFEMPLKPEVAAKPTPSGKAWFGVAVNGVPFEAGTNEYWGEGWNYEAIHGSIDLGLDQHRAHVQPSGAYHYHGLPTGLIAKLGGDAGKMLFLGWAADGFPIYTNQAHADAADASSPLKEMKSSYRLKAGTRPGSP